MMFQYTPYTVPLVASGVLALANAVYVRRHSDSLTAKWYAIAMLGLVLWAWSAALALSVTAPLSKRLLLGFYFGCTVTAVVAHFLFAVSYAGHNEWLTPRVLGLCGVLLGLTLGLSVTNPFHNLVFVDEQVVRSGGWVTIKHTFTPVAWAAVLAAWILHLTGNGLLFRKFRRSRNVYRTYTFIMVVAWFCIWVANVLSVSGLAPTPHMTFVPIVFLFWGVLGLAGIASIRFVKLLPVDKVIDALTGAGDDVVPLGRDFVLEDIDSGILILDGDDNIVDANTMGKKMLGANEHIVGKPIRGVVDIDAYFEDWSGTGEHNSQIWVPSADDEAERCYDVTVSNIDGGNDDVVGRTVVMNDITEQKRREQTLRESESELETMKQVFSRILRHNIRNDVNVIRGHAELIRRTSENGSTSHAEKILAKADDLATTSKKTRIVDSVVGTDSGTIEVAVDSLVDNGLADVAVSDTDAVVEVDVPEDVTVRGNEFLSAAIENAVENGIVHNDSDPPVVEIEATADAETVSIHVTDNGPGIPDHELAVLENGEETSLVHASGVGLWLIDRIVENSDGNVTFESTDDGSLTTIELPRVA
ncbi:MAG: histidine kinase N-terminal 7TM domain-containing protein [Halorientalis sp.]